MAVTMPETRANMPQVAMNSTQFFRIPLTCFFSSSTYMMKAAEKNKQETTNRKMNIIPFVTIQFYFSTRANSFFFNHSRTGRSYSLKAAYATMMAKMYRQTDTMMCCSSGASL